MRYALDQQGSEIRGGVGGDTAWELCCRLLEQPMQVTSLGSRQLAQLLFLLGSQSVSSVARTELFQGILEDLRERGKRFRRRPTRRP